MAAAQPKKADADAAGASAAAKPGQVAPAAAVTELTLRFSADSYVEVFDASGKALFQDVGGADSVRTVRGKAPLRVMLGNAPGVGVEINGHRTPIEARPDGSAHFVVSKDGRAVKRGS
jgi:cytoskeleton protein RodZ